MADVRLMSRWWHRQLRTAVASHYAAAAAMVAMQEERRRSSSSALHRRGSRHGSDFWKEEAGSHGVKLMQKMGWKEGAGLGKGETGTKDFVRARQKRDQRGVGAAQVTGDARQNLFQEATTDLFNQLLQRLNTTHKTNNQQDGGVGGTAEEEQTTTTAEEEEGAEEVKEDSHQTTTAAVSRFISRRHLYAKFRRAKDTAGYSTHSLREIMGGRARKGGEGGGEAKEAKEATEASPTPPPPTGSSLLTASSLSMTAYFQQKMRLRSQPSDSASPPSVDAAQAAQFDRLQASAVRGRGGLGFHSTAATDTTREERKEREEAREREQASRQSSEVEAWEEEEAEAKAEGREAAAEEEVAAQEREERRRKKRRRMEDKAERSGEAVEVGDSSLVSEGSELPQRRKKKRSNTEH